MEISTVTQRLRELEAMRVDAARWDTAVVREIVDHLHAAQADLARTARELADSRASHAGVAVNASASLNIKGLTFDGGGFG